jgi:hypothetical protein
MRTPNPITGNCKRHNGASIDKQTDNGGRQSQMMMIRMNFDGTPLTIFWSLDFLNLDTDTEAETDDDSDDDDAADADAADALAHEGSGYCCYNKLMAAIDDLLGPQFHVRERNPDGTVKKWGDAILVSGHLPQYRSTAADGEFCYNGEGPIKSVRARLRNPDVGVGDASHVMIHD